MVKIAGLHDLVRRQMGEVGGWGPYIASELTLAVISRATFLFFMLWGIEDVITSVSWL